MASHAGSEQLGQMIGFLFKWADTSRPNRSIGYMKSIAITLLVLFSSFWATAQETGLRLFYGQQENAVRSIRYTNPPFINLNDFLRGLEVQPGPETDGKITLEINGRKLVLDSVRKVATYHRKELPFPVRRNEGEIYARVGSLVEIFSYLLGREMIYEASSKTLHVPRTNDLVVRARTRRIAEHFRIILDYSHAPEKPQVKQTRNQIIVKLHRGDIMLDRGEFEPNEAVKAMQVFQHLPDGSTEIVFSTTDATDKITVDRFNPNNPRTVLKLTGRFSDQTPTLKKPDGKVAGIRRIVIDPGHGGKDHGAVGPTGLQEKKVTLALALKLKQALEQDESYEVLLTREDDSSLSLKARTGLANHFKADLFVSIHVNAIPSQNATGSETYYLSLDDSQAVDNSHYEEIAEIPAGSETGDSSIDDELSLMLWDMAQTKHLDDSFRVARYIQESLNLLSGIKSRGVKQLPLKVLRGATMPAVLIEVAFISNKFEEKKLKTISFRERVAASVSAAIRMYDEDVKRRAKGRNPADTEDGP